MSIQSQAIQRTLLSIAFIGAILSALFLVEGILAPPGPHIIQAGFYGYEHNQAGSYRFSQPQASILVHGTSAAYVLNVRIQSPQPLLERTLTLRQHGQTVAAISIGARPRTLQLLMPKPERPGIGSLIEMSTTAAAAPGDDRALGLMYDRLTTRALYEQGQLPGWLRWLLVLAVMPIIGLLGLRLRSLLTLSERRHGSAALILAGLVLIFFAPSILTGKVLSAADMIFVTPVFRQYAPEGFTQASNPLLSDQPYQFIPWRLIAWQALHEGRLPLWDTHSLAGRPFLATQQAAFFYPLNIILSILPFKDTFLWSAIVRLWLAGFGTWLLGRSYRLSYLAALLAAISFMLCGFLIVWLNHPHTNVAICLPWLLLCGERLLYAEQPSQRWREAAYLALVTGIQFTGGHIQTSLDILVAFGMYMLLRWWHMPRPRLKQRFYPVIIALLLGVGLAAIHLLPFMEWLPYSEVLHDRSSRPFTWLRPEGISDTLSLLLFAYPNLYNNPTWPFPGYYNPYAFSNYNEATWYIGVIGLVCVFVGISVYARHQALVRIWLIICLLALGRALQWPVFDWLNQLPGFALAVPARNRLIVQFGLCMLAGFGAEALWQRTALSPRPAYRSAMIGFGSIIALGLGISLWGSRWIELWSGIRPAHLDISNRMMYLPAVLAMGAIGLLLVMRLRQGLVVGLLVLASLDLILFGQTYNPVIEPAYFYPTTAALRRIQADPALFRVSAPHVDMVPDVQTLYDLADIRGLDFRTTWYSRYVNLIPGRGGSLYYTGFTDLTQPLARALNIKYILSESAKPYAKDPSLQAMGQIDGIAVWYVRDPAPRAILTQEIYLADNDDQAAERLGQNPHIPFSGVILLAEEQAPVLLSHAKPAQKTLTMLNYAPESSTWRVVSDQPVYMLLQDTYYPGWKASLDGAPTPIYRANLAFRAVYVPAGEHIIAFTYQPWWLTLGIVLSISSLVIIAGVLHIVASDAARRRLKSHLRFPTGVRLRGRPHTVRAGGRVPAAQPRLQSAAAPEHSVQNRATHPIIALLLVLGYILTRLHPGHLSC